MSVANGTYTRTNSFGKQDETCFPRFFIEAVENPIASQQAGRPIWNDVEMVEVNFPGNNLTKWVGRVTDEHRERWPEHYRRFKAQEEQRPDGMPIEEWPMVTRAQVRELKALEMHTVEQIAAMSEIAIQRIGMGARDLKQKAQAYLAELDGVSTIRQTIEENERLKTQVAAQQNQINELGAILENMQRRLQMIENAPSGIGAVIPATLDPAQAAAFRNGGVAAEAPAESALAKAAEKSARAPRKTLAAKKAEEAAA